MGQEGKTKERIKRQHMAEIAELMGMRSWWKGSCELEQCRVGGRMPAWTL